MRGSHTHTPGINSQGVAYPGRTPRGRPVGRARASNRGRPAPRQGAPPPGALELPPQRATPARKSAHSGISGGSPRRHRPRPEPVCSGPWPHAPMTGGQACVSAKPRRPHTQAGDAPPRAPSCRPPKRAKPAREIARSGVGDRSPHPHPSHPQPVGSGPRPHAPRMGGGATASTQPRTPRIQARGAPPWAPSCHPHSAQSQLARARAVGLVADPHAQPPRSHSQWVAGPGRTIQGHAVGRPRAPNPGRPTPRQETPWAPSCRPNSAQSQLARTRAVRMVTAPQNHPPRTHSQWVAESGRTPQGRVVGRAQVPNPGRPLSRQEAPPPGRPRAAPKVRKAS